MGSPGADGPLLPLLYRLLPERGYAHADGGSITKQQVVTWLEDCIANSGHQLVGDFRNLWAYTNEYTVDDYAYTAGVTGVDGQPLRWAGNGNAELCLP